LAAAIVHPTHARRKGGLACPGRASAPIRDVAGDSVETGRIIRLDPMLLNPLITNRNRQALGDEWQRPSKGVGDRVSVDHATVSPALENCRPLLTMAVLKPGSPLFCIAAVESEKA